MEISFLSFINSCDAERLLVLDHETPTFFPFQNLFSWEVLDHGSVTDLNSERKQEIDGVRKEKERLTAASQIMFFLSIPLSWF